MRVNVCVCVLRMGVAYATCRLGREMSRSKDYKMLKGKKLTFMDSGCDVC